MKNFNKQIDEFLGKDGKRRLWVAIILAVLLACILMVIDQARFSANIPEFVSHEQYLSDLKSGNIDTVYYTPSSSEMRYTLVNDTKRAYKNSEDTDDYKKCLAYKHEKSEWRRTLYPGREFRKDTFVIDGHINLAVRDFAPMSTVFLNFILTMLLMFIIIIVVLKLLVQLQTGSKKYERTF